MEESKNKLALYDLSAIQRKIYTVRGEQVMLDRDLAELYQVKAIRLREQIKRNLKRFPSDFMFQLTNDEVALLVSQNAIPSKKHLGGYLPYVFTEQGVANLASVLNSDRAIDLNIQIMRAFVAAYPECLSYRSAHNFLPIATNAIVQVPPAQLFAFFVHVIPNVHNICAYNYFHAQILAFIVHITPNMHSLCASNYGAAL